MADVGNIGKFGKKSGVDLNTVKGGLKKEAMKTDEQKSIFDAVDADKNGVLDEKEVKAFKENLDTSQDGVISKKEAKKFLKSLNLNEVDQKELLKFLLDYSLNTENVQDVRIKEENGQKLIEVVYKDGTTEVVHSDKSSEVTTLPDENGNVTTQFLTADKKLTKTSTTSANGDVTETEYAEDGETPVSSEITGKNGSVATISYEEGKPVSKQVKHGSTTSNYTYSEDGTEVLNSKIENEGVPTKERRIEYSYDENGVVTANITEQGKTTVQTIVDNKVQSETITEEGKTTVRTHNEDGTLTEEITTADGSETTVYNSENKKLSKTKVIDGEEYTIQYDGEGNTVGIIVQNGESPALIAKRFGCDVKDLLELNKSQLKGKGKSRYFNVAAEIKIPGEIEPDAKVLQGRQTKDEAVAAYKVTAEQIKAKKEAEAKAEADRIAAENKAKLDKENIALQKESAKQIYNDLMEAIDGINDDDDIYKALKQIDDPTEMAEVERLLQAKGYKADNYYSAVERFMQDELSDSKSYDKSFDEMEELVKTWISNGTLDGDKAINAQARLAARLIIDGCDGLGTDVEEAKEGVRLIKAPKLTGDPAVDNANAKKVYEQVENIIKKHKSFGAGFKGLKDYLKGDVTKAEIKYLDGILAQTNAIQGEEKAEAVKTLVKEAVEGGGTNIEELKQALMAINSPEDRKNIEAQLKEYCKEKGIKPQIEGQDYLQAILYDECDTFFGVSTDHDEIRKFNEMMIEQGAYTEEEITKLRAETAALQMLDGGFDNIQQAATTIKDKTTFAKLDELLKTKNYSGVEGFVNKSFTSQVNRDKVFAQFAANNLLSSEKTIQVATRLLQNSDYDTRALGVMSIRNGQVASGVDKALKEKGKSLEQILTKFNEDKAIYQVKAKVWDGLAAFGLGHLAEHISDEYRENTDMSDNLYLESDTPIELSQSQIAAYEMTVKTLEDGLNQMKADYQSALDSQGVVSGAVNAFCSLYNLGTTRDEIEARIEHEEETVRLLKMAAQGKLSKLENGKTVSVSFEDVFNERQSKVVSANGVTTENLVNLVKPKDVKFDVAKVEKVANKAQTIVAMDYAKDNIAVCWSELDRGLKANSNKELSVAICDTLDKLSQMSGKEMNLSAFGYEVKDGVIVDKSGKPVPASDLKEIANQLKQGLSDVSSSLFGTTIPANSSYDDVVDLLEDGYEDKMDAFKQEYRDAFGQDATDEMIENYLSTINTGKMIVNVGAAIGAVIAAPFTGGGSLAVFAFGTAASMGLNALEKSTDADGYTRTEWTSDAEQALWDGALAAIGFKVGVGADKLATQGFKEGSKLAKLANDLMAKNKALIKKWAPNLSPEKAEQAAVWMSRTEAAFGEISSDTAQSVIQSYCMEGEFNSESFLTGMIMSVAGNAAGHTFSAISEVKAIKNGADVDGPGGVKPDGGDVDAPSGDIANKSAIKANITSHLDDMLESQYVDTNIKTVLADLKQTLEFIDDPVILEYLDNVNFLNVAEARSAVALVDAVNIFNGHYSAIKSVNPNRYTGSDFWGDYKSLPKSQKAEFMSFIKTEDPKLYDDLINDRPVEITSDHMKKFTSQREAKIFVIDARHIERTSELIRYMKENPNSPMSNHLYGIYIDNIKAKGMPADIVEKMLRIDEKFGTKIVLAADIKDARDVMDYIDEELSLWTAASNGTAKIPPVFDFNSFNRNWYDNFSAHGQSASAAYSQPHYSGSLAFSKTQKGLVKYSLRHEMTHTNDLKLGSGFSPELQAEISHIMPKTKKKIQGRDVDVPDMTQAKYVEEFRRAGIPEAHIPYAYNNTKEFIAVAAEGDMSKYSQEFKDLLVELGMPKWMLDFDNPDVLARAHGIHADEVDMSLYAANRPGAGSTVGSAAAIESPHSSEIPLPENDAFLWDFFSGNKSGNDVKAVMKKVTGPDGTPKYTKAQINELLELSQVPVSDEVLTELLKYPVAPEIDFYIKKQIIQQLKTPDDVQVLPSLMNIAKSDVLDVELRLATIGDIIDIANFDGKVSNPAEVFDKINTLIRNGKMDLPETRDALVILSKFLQSDEHKSFLMKLLDSFEQNDYRTAFWSYGDKLNSISAPLTIKNLNSLIEKYPDNFRPKYDDSGIIAEQTEAGITSIIDSISPADDVAGFQVVLMNDLCAQGASIDRIAEVLSSFRLVGDMDNVNPQAVVELMNRGASGRIIELAILRDLPASVLDNPALKYLEANNYKIDYENNMDVLTLLSADLSTPQQIQAFNNLLAAKDLGIQPVEITTIVSSIKTDADVAKLQAMIDSGKIDTFKFLQDIKPTTIDVDVPTTPEVKPVTPEAAVQIRMDEIKRLNLTYGIDINHSSALVEMKINNPKRFAKIENSGLLDLIRDGKVNIKILQRLEDSPNMFFSNRTLEEIRRIANGEPLVPSIPKSEIEAISKHVTNGNVCEIDGALYVNDNGSPVRLKISKEAFENLFPPLGNVAFKQGNIGDCWFVSTLENLMDKPAGRVAVYNMFEQQGDDILVRFPGSQDAVLFNKGQLAYNGRGPAIQSAEGSDFSALAGTPKGVQMIEQAYAVHRLKSGARAYDANLNITDISKLTDTSALLKRMQGGTEREAFCDLLGTPDVANTRDKTHFIRLIEQRANDPNFVVEFGTVEKPGFQIESDLDAKYDLYSTHAYAIKGYNPETGMVYISNPWSTHTITEVPMFELTKHMGDMTVVDLRSVQRADVPEPVDVSALKNQIMELPVVSRYHGEFKDQLADKIAIAVMQGAENNPKLIAKRLEVVNLDKMSVLSSIDKNPENATFVIDNYEAFDEIEDNLIGRFPRQIGQIFEATNAGNIDRIQALSRQVKAGNVDAINEINYIQFSAKPHEVIYGDTTVDVDSEVILSLLASRNHHNNLDFDTEIGKLFTSEVNMLEKKAYTKSLAGILEQKPELVDFVETTQNMTAPEYLAYVDKLIADGVIPEKMTFRTFAPDPNGVDAELAVGAYIHMKKANKYMDVDVSASAKTVSTEGQHEGILDIFKKKKPVTTTSIVEKLSPEFQDLRARLLSSEMPTTFDKSYFESWAKENGLTLQYESNGTVAKFVDEDGLVLRRITEDSTKPGMVYDDRVSVFDEKGAQIGGKNTFSWDPRPLIFDVVDGHTANMVTLDASGNWVDKASGLRVNYNPITGMEAGMHGSVFGRIKDMFGGPSKQVDLSKNYDVSVSDAKIEYPNEGLVRSGQHQRALGSYVPSSVRTLDPSVNPRNIAQHVENGGVCSINGKLYANSNGNAVELKMSQETFERLFPEKGFATIKQRKGTNVCWLVSSLNSMATTVDGKIKIYSMIEELSDGSIKVQLAGPSKSFYIFPKGKALVAPEIQLGNGAAPGVEMIEQAVLANKLNFSSGTSLDMDSCANLVFAAGKMRTVSEAYELLGVSVKTCCNCQKSKSVDENIVKLHNFLKGRTWQDDVVTGTWNYHVRHITNYDPNTQMLTFHDPYFDGVDIQMPLDKFAATDPFIYSGTCGVSSRSQAKSHVVQQETPVQPSRPQRTESAISTRQSQIETTHSARAHVEQRAANIVSRNEWTKAGVDANGKEISVKQLSAGSVIVDRGGRKSVERFAEGQTRIELGKDANGVNLILTKSPDGDIRLSKLDPNGRASRLDNRANPEVKVETKTTSTTTSTSTSRVEDRAIRQRADVDAEALSTRNVKPQTEVSNGAKAHVEQKTTTLMNQWRTVATTAEGTPIEAKIQGDIVTISKNGKETAIPIAKGEEISVHETSTDSYLIIKREGYKTTITTSETPELDGVVSTHSTNVEAPKVQPQPVAVPSKPKFLQSGVETEIGTINGKPLKAKYESLSADRVATIKINGKIYNVGPGSSLDVADGITIINDKIGRVTFTNSQGADAPQVKPQERSSFADRFARRQEVQQPQNSGIGSFNPSRQPVQPSRPEVQATTEQPKTQTPSQNNGIGSFSSFSATRQVETPAVKPTEASAKPADTPVRPESKSQSNGIGSFDTPRQDVQASSSNTGIGSFGDVKPAMDRPALTRKITEDEIHDEMDRILKRNREIKGEIQRSYDAKFEGLQTRQSELDVEYNEFNATTRASIEQKRAQMDKLFHEIHDEKRLLEVLERQDRQLEQQFLEYKSALYDLEKKLELFEASHGRDGGSIGELYNYASEQRRRTIGAEFKDNMMEKVIPENAPSYYYDPELAELFHAYNITTGDNKARVVAELREKLAEITGKYERNTARLTTCREGIESMQAQRSALSKDIVDLGEAQAQRRADYRAEKEALAGEVESTKAAKEQAEADVKNSPEVAKNSERYRELQRQLRGEIPMEDVPIVPTRNLEMSDGEVSSVKGNVEPTEVARTTASDEPVSEATLNDYRNNVINNPKTIPAIKSYFEQLQDINGIKHFIIHQNNYIKNATQKNLVFLNSFTTAKDFEVFNDLFELSKNAAFNPFSSAKFYARIRKNPVMAAKYQDMIELAKDGIIDPLMLRSYPNGTIDIRVARDVDILIKAKRQNLSTDQVKDLYIPKFDRMTKEQLNSIPTGGVIEYKGDLVIKIGDSKLQKINMSRDSYFELFPPAHYVKQQQAGKCYLYSTILTALENPRAKAKLLNQCFAEHDGVLTVKMPGSKVSFDVPLDNISGAVKTSPYYARGCTGVNLLEQAYEQNEVYIQSQRMIDYLSKKISENDPSIDIEKAMTVLDDLIENPANPNYVLANSMALQHEGNFDINDIVTINESKDNSITQSMLSNVDDLDNARLFYGIFEGDAGYSSSKFDFGFNPFNPRLTAYKLYLKHPETGAELIPDAALLKTQDCLMVASTGRLPSGAVESTVDSDLGILSSHAYACSLKMINDKPFMKLINPHNSACPILLTIEQFRKYFVSTTINNVM